MIATSSVTFFLLWTLVSGYTINNCPANLRDQYTQVYRDKCYRFVVFATSDYHEAKAYCVKLGHGGNLAMVKSQPVNTFINERLKNSYGFYGTAWIGLNDIAQEGTFEWEDGSPMVFKNFVRGANEGPDRGFFSFSYIYEDCVAMDTNQNGEWRDYRCSHLLAGIFSRKEMPFVCEIPVGEYVTTTLAPENQTTTNSVAQNNTKNETVTPTYTIPPPMTNQTDKTLHENNVTSADDGSKATNKSNPSNALSNNSQTVQPTVLETILN